MMKKTLQTFSLIFLLTFSAMANDICVNLVEKLIAKQNVHGYAESAHLLTKLKKFADDNKLLNQVLEVGPGERRVERLFVAIDMNDEEMVQKYLKAFNLEDSENPVLALEFGFEVQSQYVTGVLRTSPDPTAPIYRWGKKDLPRNQWAQDWMIKGGFNRYPERLNNPIWGYSHILEIDKSEAKNVKHFLENPLERGPCKSDNCVAWTSSIELGLTKPDSTTEERKYLFNELGVSRASAHYEIGRRLMHATDQRHSGVIVFVNGEKGREAFAKNLRNFLPPEPQIPYTNIIKGLGHDPKGELMAAVGQIPDGSKIFFPIAAGASPEAMSAIIQRAAEAKKGFDISILVNGINESTLRKGAELPGGKIRFNSLFVGSSMRKLHSEGKINYIPGYLSDFPRYMRDPKMKDFQYDVIVVRVSPPNEEGFHSFGPNYDMIHTILEAHPNIKIIAEVNPNIPFTAGENKIHSSKITAMFKSTAKLAGPPVVPFTDVEKNIGKYLGELIENDSTLQVGIGNIFGGLADGLQSANRTNLKISTEMFGDGMKEIMERGIATKAETGFAYGSEDLYKWLNKNKIVQFVSTEKVNDPSLIQNTEKFHAVNTALQVDLRGSANAEMGPEGRLSSPGGQVEFMSAASRSNGGKSIIAIRSTAKNGEFSTIGLNLYAGNVTTPAESVHYVVTEYGIAMLKGKSESERAISLINIAHPKFRAGLRDKAVEANVLSSEDAAQIIIDVPVVANVKIENYRHIASESSIWMKIWTKIVEMF
ncbi:MAG: acetyl-CoA hydrolase/transferase family protein [Bacteriovorax sp.]|nr:acetyl-CoA hydrolase/transferase family protein [Bacteriovorax sp.]